MRTALVLGAGGFIGSHMVKRLKSEDYFVVGVDLKYPEFEPTQADIFHLRDLSYLNQWDFHLSFDEIYQFAADMGGAGYIFTGEHDADVMINSCLINLCLCRKLLAELHGQRIFYSSSACMYPSQIQEEVDNKGLKESDGYPGNPDSEYGWEKLFSERLYLAACRNYGFDVRVARFHNIYGPQGTYQGGREKAPAAMCRKVNEAKEGREIMIWGDGYQTRSFLYIDDCIDAIRLLMQSNYSQPINIGSEEMVSINWLAQLAINISGKRITVKHDLSNKALGVRGRNSNNDLIRQVLQWEPKYSLRQGMEKTYQWINQQINAQNKS